MIGLYKIDEKYNIIGEPIKTFENGNEAEKYVKENYEYDEIDDMMYHIKPDLSIWAVSIKKILIQMREMD